MPVQPPRLGSRQALSPKRRSSWNSAPRVNTRCPKQKEQLLSASAEPRVPRCSPAAGAKRLSSLFPDEHSRDSNAEFALDVEQFALGQGLTRNAQCDFGTEGLTGLDDVAWAQLDPLFCWQ